jgi:DHA1 family bicyclomycin/chloramphenicol resistance-like MFS transporter
MFVGSSANGIVAGVISPLVMHSTVALATASLAMLGLGLLSWTYIRYRWPEIGLNISHG